MTLKRRITYGLIGPIFKLILYSLWATCRVKRIEGQEHFEKLAEEDRTFIPCFWHQHHIFCTWYMKQLLKKGMRIGFLVSPSVDGEIPARMVSGWGAKVIRGSTTRAGAQALRDMYNVVVKDKVSPVTTSDGPLGPLHQFKTGDVLLSQFTQAPLVPLSYSASRFWQLKSWDRFIVPKPFARIVITIGAPVSVDKSLRTEDLEPIRSQMEQQLNTLAQQASDLLNPDK